MGDNGVQSIMSQNYNNTQKVKKNGIIFFRRKSTKTVNSMNKLSLCSNFRG